MAARNLGDAHQPVSTSNRTSFQGRFKGILLEPEALAPVTSYIHLNPQRAGIELVDQIGEY
ncbi:MAG: hypothetical protein O3C20_23035, partial [Verrucomicrobia bacterium]|nr:hypothetical protein [Verrucomicrobiota bacterium]